MLTEVCAYLRNWFSRPADRHPGTYEISGGQIAPLDFLQEGQYFRIIGSTFNDGVYQYGAADLTDETFTGSVWAMAVPPHIPPLVEEMEKLQADLANESDYTSESFAGYSYSKAQGKDNPKIRRLAQIERELRRYRKL